MGDARQAPGLRGRMVLAFVLVAATSVTLAVGIFALQASGSLRASISERNLQIARAGAAQISQYLGSAVEEVQAWAEVLEILPTENGVQSVLLQNAGFSLRRFRSLAVAESGTPLPAGSDEVLRPGGPWGTVPLGASAVVRQQQGQPPHVVLSVPVALRSGAAVRLAAELSLDPIWQLLDGIRLGKTGHAYLTSGGGVLIAHPDKAAVAGADGERGIVPLPASPGDSGTITTPIDRAGARQLVASCAVPGSNWVIAVQQPLSEAFIEPRAAIGEAAAVLAAGIAFAVLLGMYMARRISRPFEVLQFEARRVATGIADAGLSAQQPYAEAQNLAQALSGMVQELQRGRRELELSEAQHRMVLDGIDEIVFQLDLDGKLLFANRKAAELSGHEVGHLSGSSILDFLAPESAGRAMTFLARVRAGEARSIETDVIMRSRDGAEIPLDVRMVVWEDAAGVQRLYGVAGDASERRRLQEQLLHSQKMEAIGRLAGGVAHDFNNLLTVIVGYAQLCRDSAAEPETVRASASEIEAAAARAAGLTRQLLAFSRKQVLQPTTVGLNELLLGITAMLGRLIGEDISVRTELAPDLGIVRADAGQLEQVITNLVVNARDAMPSGGTLYLRTENRRIEQGTWLHGFDVREGEYVTLAVGDTGTGMDQYTRERAFEPFFTTKEPGKGTGLGLSTVYGIVKQSGGYVVVESTLWQGSWFTIYLPRIAEQDGAPAPTGPDREAPIGGTERILVVEDEESVRRTVTTMLRQLGYDAMEAASGPIATKALAADSGRVDLLVADIVMPGMRGDEAAAVIRKSRPEIKVLYISGHAERRGGRPFVLRAGEALLNKPFTSEELSRSVRRLLDGRSGAEEGSDRV